MPFKATKYQPIDPGPPLRVACKSPKFEAEVVDITGVWPLPEGILHRESVTVRGRLYALRLVSLHSQHLTELAPGAVRDCLRWFESYSLRQAHGNAKNAA